MILPTFREIEQLATKHNLKVFQGSKYELPEVVIKVKEVQDSMLDEFIDLVKMAGKKYFFANVNYICDGDKEIFKDIYCINLEEISEEEYGSSYKKILKGAKEYNERILKLPITEPSEVELFFIDGNVSFSIELDSEWSKEIDGSDEALEGICDNYEVDLEEFRAQKRISEENEMLKQLEEIEQELLIDEIFKKCTTKSARLANLKKVLQKHGLSEMVFKSRSQLEGFVDLAWAKVKENTKATGSPKRK